MSWREPTSAIDLRYGDHRHRSSAAVALLLGGGILLQFGSAYTLPLLVLGVVATAAGWAIVPSAGWRRSVAVGPGILGAVGLLNGAQSGALVALALAAWLLVRARPLLSYAVLVIPIASAYLMALAFPQYPGRGLVTAVLIGTVVGSAWIARSLAAMRLRH